MTVSFPQSKVKSEEFADIVACLTSVPDTTAGAVFSTKRGKIPNQANFPKAFYRLLDSVDLDEEMKGRLMEVEESLFVRQVLDHGQWPVRPDLDDHLNGDRVVGETIWSSLEERYRNDKLWGNPATAPLIVRIPWNKNKRDKEDDADT